ncbi:tRNA pseudouridine(38-40) synthase TruA [Sulfuricurvum sp.]|uniref:tRNA pseudouridine(38-40) synthase TruA n=1 Tax=Sulfuricurvum sp. TaxID=2025608 RepID=UPI002D67D95F|nr:tRNA pseudouridine(38-40) synthase TruA [Sulfuricurvum sp.]HZF69877.1 tRNA pseudouridine(38-40) synthase TruA [Sulfuricurvum sp.]
MNRAKITMSYNGSAFLGSQQQTTTHETVIGTLLIALQRLKIHTAPKGSGRTDRGVHATHQVMHIDLPHFWTDLPRLKDMLNLQLPASLRILRIEFVDSEFHARYSAKRRVYRYVIKEGISNPFEDNFITFVPNLNREAIIDAIKCFEGVHSFEFFKKSGNDLEHFTRIIYRAYAYSHKGYFVLVFEGNGFLRSQIRLMVGFLLRISAGKATKEQLIEQLNCVKRYSTDIAPHNGLYLTHIKY